MTGPTGPTGLPGPTGQTGHTALPEPRGQQVRANSVLPAERRAVTLRTADGLRLVGELAVPVGAEPVATIVCLHPLPTAGGMMDSHVLRKAAFRLPALAHVAVLRFNTRGTSSPAGTSEGVFDDGRAEGLDVAAAVGAVVAAGLPDPWLLGWSFGTELALVHGLLPPVRGAVLLSPPLRPPARLALPMWAQDGRPLVAVVPEFDDYLRPAAAREAFGSVPQARVVAVDGARHLWVGAAERVLDEVVRAVVGPGAPPLPGRWAGPMTTADLSAHLGPPR